MDFLAPWLLVFSLVLLFALVAVLLKSPDSHDQGQRGEERPRQ